MSRLYNQPIQVRLVDNLPSAIFWRRRWQDIMSIDRIQPRRSYLSPYLYNDTYRVVLKSGTICDLVKKDGWILEKVWD